MVRITLALALAATTALAEPGDENKNARPSKRPESERSQPAPDEKKEDKGKDQKEQKGEAKIKETKGSVKIAGTDVSYVAQTGTLPLLKDDGSPRADVFFVYYTVVDADGKALAEKDERRPIM